MVGRRKAARNQKSDVNFDIIMTYILDKKNTTIKHRKKEKRHEMKIMSDFTATFERCEIK